MKYIFLILALFAFGNAGACVQSVTSTPEYTEICVGGSCGRILTANLRPGSHTLKSAQLETALQAWLDYRQPILELDFDEETRFVDPKRPDFFWSDIQGNPMPDSLDATHITARPCIVQAVEWDGAQFNITVSTP